MPEFEQISDPFLLAHPSEVKGMLLTEYNEAATMELFREDGWQEGFLEGFLEGFREGYRKGFREGILSTLIRMVQRGRLSVQEAAADANMTEAAFMGAMAEYK